MTREEMLRWLEEIKKDIYVCSLESTFADDAKSCAIYQAIQTLSTELCDDAISRMRVFSAIHNTHLPKEYEEPLWNKISDLPSVQPVRPKGEWERVTDKTGHLVWECKCGWQERLSTNFCPNCGADMEGEKNDT